MTVHVLALIGNSKIAQVEASCYYREVWHQSHDYHPTMHDIVNKAADFAHKCALVP